MIIQVRKGDTLSYYSMLFHVPLPIIEDSNEIGSTSLQIGQKLHIPGYTIVRHHISKGETLYSIAKRYQVPLDSLCLLNPLVDPMTLIEGQAIDIPRQITGRSIIGKKEYDYSTLRDDVKLLQEIYPFVKINTFGYSVMGKELIQLKWGRGKKKVHINASFHANEWITTAILMLFINDYLLNLTTSASILGVNILDLYKNTTLSVVPMVDPDGVDLVLHGPPKVEPYHHLVMELNKGDSDYSSWKANIRGVDLNNQFPARWEIEKARKPKNPGPRDYPGDFPLSEPEAKAMAELTKMETFDRVIALHTQGKEIYWGFERAEPPESKEIVDEFSKWSGYKAIQYLDSYAGYKDWFIQEWRKPGFTVELGKGVNPLPLSQFDEIYKDTIGIFLASLYM